MQSKAKTVKEYLTSLPEDRKKAVSELRTVILKNLPKGFAEEISYGVIGYVVPHSLYPDGYHCDPNLPLPFMGMASQKNFVSFYHMGIYADKKLLDWFTKEYPKYANSKLDMGKSCIRFKKMDGIPLKLIGELVSKVKAEDWITIYEKNIKNK
jgi:uncharacterized protein YdhG (YjbR/CyaY superfamily)